MKLSFRTILPIILISALLILLTGCAGVTPDDDSPGYTPGTISGIIAAPCCDQNSVEAAEGDTTSPEYWCSFCRETWNLQKGIEVVLTYGEDEVATTTTNDKGEFTFTNVDPGKNYVITAYCPEFDDNRPLVKDVALELIEGGSFDTKVTDLVSTSLGLVVDFLVTYTELTPEDIELDEVIAANPDFIGFPKFKTLVRTVRIVLESCGNVDTDEDVQDALCLAAEEVGRIVLPDLDLGCAPGFTPATPNPNPPPPPPPPIITYVLTTAADPAAGGSVSGAGTYNSGTVVPVIMASPTVGWTFTGWSGDLTGTTNPTSITMNSNKNVVAHFTEEDLCADNAKPVITDVTLGGESIFDPDPAQVPEITLVAGKTYVFCVYATDDDILSQELTYSLTMDDGTNPPFDIPIGTNSDGFICYTAEPLFGDVGTYEVTVNVDDGCEITSWGPVTVIVCQPIDQVVLAAGDDDTICVGETVALGDLIGSVKTYANSVLQETITDPCDPRLAFSFTDTDGAVSFDLPNCEVTGITAGTVDITVVYTPGAEECGAEPVPGDAAVTVTVEDCCLDPILDLLEFRVKLPSNGSGFENWTGMFGYLTNPSFDSNRFDYDITTGESGSPKFGFRATGCDTLTLEYNWYRGDSCTADWLTGEVDVSPDPLDDPPSWRPIVTTGIYPELNSENSLCNQGGNILKIKVTTTLGHEEIYTININRVVVP